MFAGCGLHPIYQKGQNRGGTIQVLGGEQAASAFVVQRMRVLLKQRQHLIPRGLVVSVKLSEKSGNITISQGASSLRNMAWLYANISFEHNGEITDLFVSSSTSYSHLEADPFVNTSEQRSASERLMITLSDEIISAINSHYFQNK